MGDERHVYQTGECEIVVTARTGNSGKPSVHFGVIIGDDSASFVLQEGPGLLLERALAALYDGHRRH
jgi:hypothetical protein